MISMFLGFGSFAAAIVWAIKGELSYTIGFLICSGLFMVSSNVGVIHIRLNELINLYKDKVLAEKTLSALMAASRMETDDGK